MQSNSFVYSVKVWLTSVVLAPLMFLIIEICSNNRYHLNSTAFIDQQISTYAICVVFGGIFSLITWLLFFFIIKVITIYFPPVREVKYGIAVIGALLTFGTFSIFFPVFDIQDEFFYLMISNCICIAGGSCFYKLEIILEQNVISN
ncbi:MAG: hypothetical protein JWQ85_197 [Mucilaginibacter sp.]|nr:hypothetical protein [Mucilaginibacter sp.]